MIEIPLDDYRSIMIDGWTITVGNDTVELTGLQAGHVVYEMFSVAKGAKTDACGGAVTAAKCEPGCC